MRKTERLGFRFQNLTNSLLNSTERKFFKRPASLSLDESLDSDIARSSELQSNFLRDNPLDSDNSGKPVFQIAVKSYKRGLSEEYGAKDLSSTGKTEWVSARRNEEPRHSELSFRKIHRFSRTEIIHLGKLDENVCNSTSRSTECSPFKHPITNIYRPSKFPQSLRSKTRSPHKIVLNFDGIKQIQLEGNKKECLSYPRAFKADCCRSPKLSKSQQILDSKYHLGLNCRISSQKFNKTHRCINCGCGIHQSHTPRKEFQNLFAVISPKISNTTMRRRSSAITPTSQFNHEQMSFDKTSITEFEGSNTIRVNSEPVEKNSQYTKTEGGYFENTQQMSEENLKMETIPFRTIVEESFYSLEGDEIQRSANCKELDSKDFSPGEDVEYMEEEQMRQTVQDTFGLSAMRRSYASGNDIPSVRSSIRSERVSSRKLDLKVLDDDDQNDSHEIAHPEHQEYLSTPLVGFLPNKKNDENLHQKLSSITIRPMRK